MSSADRPPPNVLADPARAPFRAAQRIAALDEDLGQLSEVPDD